MTNLQTPSVPANAAEKQWNLADVGFALGLLGLSPLLYEHMLNLWRKPHFQFFPIAWLLFAYLVYERGVFARVGSPLRRLSAYCIVLFSLFAGVAAVVWFSPWLAHVAMILVCAGWMLNRLGGNAWHQPIAWLSLLLISLPMPLNLDQRLIQSLQSMSAKSASLLLDMFGVPHLPIGNVIEIRTGKLFVDEACSGVDSLYALAAVALGLVIWNKRNFLQSLLALMTVPLWAWLGNTIRILTIAIMLDRFNIDLTHGWQHSMLGMITFGLSCGCLLFTQSLTAHLLTPFPHNSVDAGPFHTLYNWVVSFPRASSTSGTKKRSPSQTESDSDVLSRLPIGILHCTVWVILGVAASLPVLGIGPWKRAYVPTPVFNQSIVEKTFVATSLPDSVAGMSQVNFQTVHRDRDNTNGAHSATWQFRDGQQLIQVSIDFPFVGFHALEVCYLLTGCTLTHPTANIEIQNTRNLKQLVVNELRFVNAMSDECFACYTAFDRNGQSVSGIESRLARGTANENAPRVSFQVQLFIEGCGDLTDEQRNRYRQILVEVCELAIPTIQALPEK